MRYAHAAAFVTLLPFFLLFDLIAVIADLFEPDTCRSDDAPTFRG